MSDAPSGPPESNARPRRSDRHGRGRRTRQRRRRRRQALARIGLAVATVISIALAVVWAVTTFDLGSDPGDAEPTATSSAPAGTDPQPAYVFATFDDAAANPAADLVFVLAHEPASGDATLLLVPASVVTDVPGHGLLQLGQAFAFNGGPLLELSLDNLLGIDLDGAVGVSVQGWSALFSRVGGLTLDVPEELARIGSDGTRTIRFRPGEQVLDGPRLAEYLTFREAGETELQRFPRVQRVLEGLFAKIAERPELLDDVFSDGAPMLDTPDREAIRQLFLAASGAEADGTLEARTLPVVPVGSGDEAAYRLDDDRAAELVTERFAPSRPSASDQAGRRLQILNGNGIPGIGQQVAERLQPAGFKVVLTRNADRFDYATTRIIVTRDEPERLAAAQQIKDLLGVGEIELSEVPLDVADITVIVGADFTG